MKICCQKNQLHLYINEVSCTSEHQSKVRQQNYIIVVTKLFYRLVIMKGNYQKILLLATMVYIGNCLPIRKTRESEETIPAMNLISGFSATRQILVSIYYLSL